MGNYPTGFSVSAVRRHDQPLRVSLVTADLRAIGYQKAMTATADNVIAFPLQRRREFSACPHCGRSDDVWLIGKLLWAYCETHRLRWVVADYARVSRATINPRELKKGLEFLAAFAEISR